ncbi:MAG TPA: acyl-CoA dehydrogenase family protein [Pseudonocardiaceae bacterium]|nr:acyl-CoA dehydrogenase family protein [Pseudonocardiaceae bacterium]
MNVFGTNVVVKHGSDRLKAENLPEVIGGRMKVAFGVSEPDSGLDTTSLKTRAVRKGPGNSDWVINGRKVWISTAPHAHKILLLCRTHDPKPGVNKAKGLSLFFTDLDRTKIDVREIEKAGRAAVDSNELFIDDLVVPDEHLVLSTGVRPVSCREHGRHVVRHLPRPTPALIPEVQGLSWGLSTVQFALHSELRGTANPPTSEPRRPCRRPPRRGAALRRDGRGDRGGRRVQRPGRADLATRSAARVSGSYRSGRAEADVVFRANEA